MLTFTGCTEHRRLATETKSMVIEGEEVSREYAELSEEQRVYSKGLAALRDEPGLKRGKTTPEERLRVLESVVSELGGKKEALEKQLAALQTDFESYKKSR